MEGNEIMMANGWPLGLGNMTSTIIRVADTSNTAAPPPQLNPSPIIRTSSFSSFSSSNIDTESTASFFPDQSVSLGRLIGIRPANKGISGEQRRKIPADQMSHHPPKNNSRGICVPLLHMIGKMSKTGSSSRY